MQLGEVCNHFSKATGSDRQYKALCPAHDDSTPSLSISEGQDGRILLNCHAGCSVEDIVERAGLTMSDLFPAKDTALSAVVDHDIRYAYTDIHGELLFTKVRKVGKKSFFIDPKGAPKALYNLAVIHDQQKVYVVEGEKDVETLRGYLPATTAPHGAKSKWIPVYVDVLKGKDVVIIPDNDEPGLKYAESAARSLQGHAKSVKVLNLLDACKGLPDKGDVTDLVESVGIEQALHMIQKLEQGTSEYHGEPLEEGAPAFYDDKRFLHHVMGDHLIASLNVCRINGSLHIYDNGVYRQGEDTLHGHMIQLVPSIKENQRREVYKYMKANLSTPTRNITPPRYIPFKTRIYDLQTDRFLDYSPDFVFLNRFPYDYRPNATPKELIAQTIRDIADNDDEVIDLLYEAIGNCFYMVNSYRGAVMLYGKSGNNGKTTLLNMISQLVGRENASALSLQDLSEKFRLIGIYGKAANIGDDIPDAYVPDSSLFKRVETGAEITAEQKGKDPVTFRPFAKMFFSMNGIPPTGDKTKAFYSRLLLIPLNRDFTAEGACDVDLKTRVWSDEEMEWLLKLAMDGLKRLMKQGQFTMPTVVEQALAEYRRENSPVLQFLEEFSVEGQPIPLAYNRYQLWCQTNGYKSLSRRNFTTEVCRELPLKSGIARHEYFGKDPGRCFIPR